MRNKQKVYYTLEWGKKAGQRISTRIFTYINPVSPVPRYHNEEALRLLEIKTTQMTLDYLAVGTVSTPTHRLQPNFLDFYKEYVSELKTFCAEIINDHKALNQEQELYKELPVFSSVEPSDVLKSYLEVKKDMAMIVQTEIERMLDTPELTDLLIRKN